MTAVPPRPAAPTPVEIRDQVDSIVPRTHEDGSVNAQHVAIEQTLRTRHGHPSYIAELDGPGKVYPAAPDATAGDGLREALVAYFLWPDAEFVREHAENRVDDLLAKVPALRDVLAAAARDAEKVRRVTDLVDEFSAGPDVQGQLYDGAYVADVFRAALDGA